MQIDKLKMSNGQTIQTVLIRCSKSHPGDNYDINDYEELHYAQNKLFLRMYRTEDYPVEDGWEENLIEEDIQTLVYYVIIPEYDELLELYEEGKITHTLRPIHKGE